MWAKLLDAVLGSLFGVVSEHVQAEQQRRSYESGIVAKAEQKRLQAELEAIIESTNLRRRVALDPVIRNSVRERARRLG
jgi:hypothetical protein